MSPKTMLARVVAPVGAAVAGAVVAAFVFSGPAWADVNVSMTAPTTFLGGQPRSFYSTATNTDKEAHKLYRVISIRMNGLSPDMVRLTRQGGSDLGLHGGGNSTLSATDQAFTLDAAVTRRGTVNTSIYTLMFTPDAPSGRATLTVDLYEGDRRVDGVSRSLSVRASGAAPTTKRSFSPEPTISGDPVAAILGQQPTYQPLPDTRPVPRSDGAPPWILYVLGGLLLAGGGGLMYWLWLGRRNDASEVLGVPTDAYSRPYRDPAVHAPTALLPTVRRPYTEQTAPLARRRPYGQPPPQPRGHHDAQPPVDEPTMVQGPYPGPQM